ncbi:inositol monophosphatase [Candidatus Woesebacteria bacterium]|nr:inositol monophosphatase [Candidatus Woesebacteria bacterium]
MSDISQFLQRVLLHSAKIANRNYGKVSMTAKGSDNNQVLTETDRVIGTYIVENIQKVFPSHNIIDEEAGVIDTNSDLTWVVDPVDGTSNFGVGLPTYGVMVGLLEGDTAIAGGIMLPAFNELFLAEKGRGATRNGTPIRVTDEQSSLSTLVAYCLDGHQEAPEKTIAEAELIGRIILSIRNLRTTNSAYDMAHVADGKYGAYLNQTTKIWDIVAFQPIIEEAGGVVTDFWGESLDYSNPLTRFEENMTICVGAPAIHEQLQKIIHEK